MRDIRIDRRILLVDVTLAGYFTPEAAMAATRDIRAAIRTLGADAGRHVTLYDVDKVQIAPGLTIEALQKSFADPSIRDICARRIAYCTSSALGRLQVARLRAARPDIGVFPDRASAIAWLLEASEAPDTPAGAASSGSPRPGA